MTILTSANGSLPLTLRKGETLVIRNYSGVETVTGSTAAREDASSTAGSGAYAYGPQTVAATLTLSSSGSLDYQVVAGDVTPGYRPGETTLLLDGQSTYGPLTISGPSSIAVTGSTAGATSSMTVVADGSNVPTITGADEWANSFGYLNTSGVPNRLDVWHDGVARRYSWSQQKTPSSVLGLEGEVASWVTRVWLAGGTVSLAIQEHVNTFVVAAKASGYWSLLTRMNLFVGDAAAALIPLLNAQGATADIITNLTLSATGFATDGTGYLRTGFIPGSSTTGGVSVYLRTTQATEATGRSLFSTRDAGTTQVFRVAANVDSGGNTSAGGVYGQYGSNAVSSTGLATTGGLTAGMWHLTRTAANRLDLVKNGVSVANNTTATTVASAGFELVLFASNSAGTLGTAPLAAGSSIGAYALDAGMSVAQAAAYQSHMQTLMTSLGRNV